MIEAVIKLFKENITSWIDTQIIPHKPKSISNVDERLQYLIWLHGSAQNIRQIVDYATKIDPQFKDIKPIEQLLFAGLEILDSFMKEHGTPIISS